MGVIDRDDMRDEILNKINRSSADKGTLIEGWLYRAVLDLATYRKFFENETSATMTQAATANTATWPPDLLVPVRLEWNDGSSLYNCTIKDIIYVREYYHIGTSGRPDYVARYGSTAYFDRNADQSYGWTVYYKSRPADFANGSAVSPLAAEWDQALILWATSEAFSNLRQWDIAKELKFNYYSYVKGRLGDIEETEGAWNESFAGDIDYDPYTF